MKGILIGEDNDLHVVDGTLAFGDTLLQEVGILLSLNKGELKSDLRIGPDLLTFIRGRAKHSEVQQRARIHLEMDNKDFDELKNVMRISLKV